MHHRPAGPPLTARVTGTVTRWGLLIRALLRLRPGRLVLAGVATTAVTALVLAVPVVSGLGSTRQPLALDSSSSTTASPSDAKSPVIMGVDGRPATSSSYSGTPATTEATAGEPAAETADVAPGTTEARTTTPEPADAPAPVAGASSGPAGPPSPSAAGSPAGAPSSREPSSREPSSGPSSSRSPSPRPPSPRPAPAPDAPPDAPPAAREEPVGADDEGDLLAELDAARVGCAPLTVDGTLSAAAQAHSAVMREAGALVPLDGWAGSIARGDTDADDVLEDWLADPTGRTTILDCDRGSVGIGLVDGPDGPWWTLLLA